MKLRSTQDTAVSSTVKTTMLNITAPTAEKVPRQFIRIHSVIIQLCESPRSVHTELVPIKHLGSQRGHSCTIYQWLTYQIKQSLAL